MTTGIETINLVGGKTITYRLSLEERIAEALGEVPNETNFTDIQAFGIAMIKCLECCSELRTNPRRKKATTALRGLLNEVSQKENGIPFF